MSEINSPLICPICNSQSTGSDHCPVCGFIFSISFDDTLISSNVSNVHKKHSLDTIPQNNSNAINNFHLPTQKENSNPIDMSLDENIVSSKTNDSSNSIDLDADYEASINTRNDNPSDKSKKKKQIEYNMQAPISPNHRTAIAPNGYDCNSDGFYDYIEPQPEKNISAIVNKVKILKCLLLIFVLIIIMIISLVLM